MERKPGTNRTTDFAFWRKLGKEFKKASHEEQQRDPKNELDRRQRAYADVATDLPEDPGANYLVYSLSSGLDEHFQAHCVLLAIEAGMALGFGRDKALTAWIAHVIADAIEHRSNCWHPLRETVQLPRREGPRLEITAEGTGWLDNFCLMSATSCLRLAQQKQEPGKAGVPAVKKPGRRATRTVSRRGDTKKAGQRLPSLHYPRSPVKRAIRIVLTQHPDFTDHQVCLQLDDDGIEVSSSRMKTNARSFQDLYQNGGKDKRKIEVMISDVRSRLRKQGLL